MASTGVGADAGADQDDGPSIAANVKVAARRRCLDGVADPDVLVQEVLPTPSGSRLTLMRYARHRRRHESE